MSLSTSQINALLSAKYCAPEWAILFEVGNSTGFSCKRHADAVAMSLWPSRGLTLHGFEVKASRSDWVKELKNPSKAEGVAQFCDFWWLVVGDRAIVAPGELPASWGLIAPKGDKLVCVTEATKNESKVPITPNFLAALFRRIHEQTRAPEKEIHQKGYEEGYQVAKASHFDSFKLPYETLLKSVQSFQETTGVSISGYNGPRVAENFRRAFRPPDEFKADLEALLLRANNISYQLKTALSQPINETCEYVI